MTCTYMKLHVPVQKGKDEAYTYRKVHVADFLNIFINRRGGVDVERSPRVREIGVRSPVATDLSRKNR